MKNLIGALVAYIALFFMIVGFPLAIVAVKACQLFGIEDKIPNIGKFAEEMLFMFYCGIITSMAVLLIIVFNSL